VFSLEWVPDPLNVASGPMALSPQVPAGVPLRATFLPSVTILIYRRGGRQLFFGFVAGLSARGRSCQDHGRLHQFIVGAVVGRGYGPGAVLGTERVAALHSEALVSFLYH